MISLTGSEGFIGSHIDFANERIDIKAARDEDVCYLNYYAGDVVIHLAAMSSVQESMDYPADTMKANIVGLAKVIEVCKAHHRRLIFASSSSVVDPQSPYAYSKLWGEELIKTSGLTNYAILRLGNVYGEGDDKSAIYKFLTDKKITIYGDGKQKRSFIHVDDVVGAIKYYADATFRRTFNIVNIGNENLTINQVAAMFGKPIRYQPALPGDNLDSTMASDWKCERTLKLFIKSQLKAKK